MKAPSLRSAFVRASVLALAASACSSLPVAKYAKSDHFDGKKFFNPGVPVVKGFFDLLKWQLGGGKKDWPEQVENLAKPELPSEVADGEVVVTFVNHATHLVQLKGLNFLTDPHYSKRASPVSWAGPSRVREPGVQFEDLPKIDLVLVSHNHYDHLDLATLKRLFEAHKPLFIVPLGNKALLESEGIQGVEELDWWQEKEFGEGFKVTLTPAQHWSARGVLDRNEALWGGFVVRKGEVTVFFAGDTGYGPHFKEIAKRLGPIRVSLLPIGAYEPRWFMREQHMNPDDAVLAHFDLGGLAIGTHYGCFKLTNEAIDDPIADLRAALAARSLPTDRFLAPETGATVRIKR